MTTRNKLWLCAFILGFALGILVFYIRGIDSQTVWQAAPVAKTDYQIEPLLAADIEGGSLKEFTQTSHQMGTTVHIKAHATDRAKVEKAFRAAFDRIHEIEGIMSLYVKDSPISQINSSGKAKGYQVPRELGKVVARSLDLCRLTGGALDITVKPLLNAYEDAANLKRAPTREEISAALEHVGHMKISVSDDLQTITVADDGMSLDLSATAKGYAVDEAAQVLRENGIVNAFVEAGGDIRFVGPRGDGSPWTTGVQDPMLRVSDDDMAVLAVLNVASGAVCTSGNYAQGYRLGGQRVSHIVDPRSGMPCDQTPSVTITAPDAFIADALATALSVLGADGLEIIEKMEDVEAFILTVENGKLVEHKTSGFNK